MVVVERRHVTLLEILIVMAILALVGGLVSIGINRALADQRFRTEVSLIVDQLRLAQDLMLVLGTDVHVKFAEDKDKSGIKYWLELETELPNEIEREVLRKHSNLKTIRGVFLKDQLAMESVRGEIDVKFLSKGSVMSRGVMRLATSDSEDPPKGTLENYICLPGYPKPIFSTDDKKQAVEICNFAADREIDLKLTQDTFSKLPDTLKLPEEAEAKEESAEEKKSEKNSSSKKQPAQGDGRASQPARR